MTNDLTDAVVQRVQHVPALGRVLLLAALLIPRIWVPQDDTARNQTQLVIYVVLCVVLVCGLRSVAICVLVGSAAAGMFWFIFDRYGFSQDEWTAPCAAAAFFAAVASTRVSWGWSLFTLAVPGLASWILPSIGPPQLLTTVAALALGHLVRIAGARARLSGRLDALGQVTRGLQAERLKDHERADLARDLHDIVGHHVTAISLLAEAAQSREPTDVPELATISATARSAMNELDTLVLSLRDPAHRGSTTVRGLRDLPDVTAALAHADVQLTLEVMASADVPLGVQGTAYRIVQEGVTNILRHAGASHAWVRVAEDNGRLQIEVEDDGQGAEQGQEHGRGLVGVRERAAAHGGTMALGRSVRGGAHLLVVLPLRR